MNDIKIQIPNSELAKIKAHMGEYEKAVLKDVQGAIRRSAYRVHAAAVRNAPSVFGKLRQSMVVKVSPGLGEVTVNVDYAGAVEFGSAPHIIRPNKKKALAFKPGGGFRFWDEQGRVVVKRVKHPGTKAQPYLTPALEREAPNFIATLKQIIENNAKR